MDRTPSTEPSRRPAVDRPPLDRAVAPFGHGPDTLDRAVAPFDDLVEFALSGGSVEAGAIDG